MKKILISLMAFTAFPFSSAADSIPHFAEYLYPEIPKVLADMYPFHTISTCQEVTKYELSINDEFINDINYDPDYQTEFWHLGALELMESGRVDWDRKDLERLTDAERKYLDSLAFADQTKFTARDKAFLAEHGFGWTLEDKEFVHALFYKDCLMKMQKAISKSRLADTTENEKGSN